MNSGMCSIVIPSYNQGAYIEDTLKSILNQTYKNVEIIVIDGGSTDNTLEVLRRYESYITYFSEKDNGQSDAINKGFRLAQGEIVTWLNSDDIYPIRTVLETVVKEFQNHREWDFIYGNFIEIDQSNMVLKMYRRPAYSFNRLLRIGYISQPATFFRHNVVQQMNIREDLNYAMDLEYWLRASKLNYRFEYINLLMAAERIHQNAKCVKETGKMVQEAKAVRVEYGATFDLLHGLFRFVDRIILYAYRIMGLNDLIRYQKSPELMTVPLNFEGSLMRTIKLRNKN